MATLDPRIIRIGIEVNGAIRHYENVAVTVTGTKYASPNQGECNITLANVKKSVSDFILTETSPVNANRTAKIVTVEAGRVSTGYSLLYTGNIFRSSISQPPDSVLSIRALTGQFQKGNIVTFSAAPSSSMSSIATKIAQDLGVVLSFEATDIQVTNYNFTGAAIKQLNKLQSMADVDVFQDDGHLVVKNRTAPRAGRVRNLDANTGMIGVPTLTEQGARITFFYDSQTTIGGQLNVTSTQYPSLTGRYVIYRLDYVITNRDVPFYYVADCTRLTDG